MTTGDHAKDAERPLERAAAGWEDGVDSTRDPDTLSPREARCLRIARAFRKLAEAGRAVDATTRKSGA